MFRFAHPYVLVLLIPALLILLFWMRGRFRSAPPVLRYSDTRLLSGLPVSLRLQLRRLPDVLRLLAWILLLVGLARPQSGTALESIRGRGVDMVMVLDISDSMGTPDFTPFSRLDAAKTVLDDFVSGRDFDRIGLVIFAEEAFYRVPPTLDMNLFKRSLADVSFAGDIGLSNRTAIGSGLASAANMLRESDAPSRVIILLTDGTNNVGTIDPLSATDAATTFGIRIYTIGMGSRAENSDLDEDTLRQIAGRAGGRYFHAAQLDELSAIYEDIDRLETRQNTRILRIRWQDMGWSLLIVSFGLLLIERFLRHSIFQTIP
ncbi:MAG: VWA domain-containing protein [Aggregatilineales bacterium]